MRTFLIALVLAAVATGPALAEDVPSPEDSVAQVDLMVDKCIARPT